MKPDYLLDVNALVAAVWTDHSLHKAADAWVKGKRLAVTPLSELGFLRISTNPKAIGSPMEDARRLLEDFLAKHQVGFVPADIRALDSQAESSDDVTDQYLAELAGKNGLKLATFDAGIKHKAVQLIQ